MPTKLDLDDLDQHELDGVEPTLKSIGYELRPEKMRPNVWLYDEGDANNRHKHESQEELYYLIDGNLTVETEEEDYELSTGEFLLVAPDIWRRVVASEESTLLVVGAPSDADDAIIDD